MLVQELETTLEPEEYAEVCRCFEAVLPTLNPAYSSGRGFMFNNHPLASNVE